MVDIPVNTQRNPVGYLARKFAINYNLTHLTKLDAKEGLPSKVPVLSTTSALAFAAYALLRLRTAQLAATDDDAAAWDAEVTAAQAMADRALASVSETNHGYFPTAQRVFAKLQTYADNHSGGTIPAPADLPTDWATSRGAQPVGATQTISQANHLALDIDLLAGVTNTETTEDLRVVSVDGKAWEADREIVIGGVTFTMDATGGDFHLTADAPGQAVATTVVPVVITDDVSAPISRNLSLTVTNTAPTANAIVTTVVNNTAISKNFITLSAGADANSDTIRVTEIDGVDVPTPFAAGTWDFVSEGKTFTLDKATGNVTSAATATPNVFNGTFKLGDNDPVDPKETAATNWSIEVLAP